MESYRTRQLGTVSRRQIDLACRGFACSPGTRDVAECLTRNRALLSRTLATGYKRSTKKEETTILFSRQIPKLEERIAQQLSFLGGASGTELVTLSGASDQPNTIAFSADGSRLAAGRRDKTARILRTYAHKKRLLLLSLSSFLADPSPPADGPPPCCVHMRLRQFFAKTAMPRRRNPEQDFLTTSLRASRSRNCTVSVHKMRGWARFAAAKRGMLCSGQNGKRRRCRIRP